MNCRVVSVAMGVGVGVVCAAVAARPAPAERLLTELRAQWHTAVADPRVPAGTPGTDLTAGFSQSRFESNIAPGRFDATPEEG